MENIKEKLRILGLEDKEIDVYLAVLGLGKSNITDIARKSSIKRTTIYGYLENLLKKGLILKTIDKKRVFYCPDNPEKIKQMLEKQKTEIDEKKEKVTPLIPELATLYAASFKRPNVSFYEGKNGLREIYWQMLNTHKTVYSIFSPQNFFELFSETENWKLMSTLRDNGGKMHSLIEKTDQPISPITEDKYKSFVKRKFLPEWFHFETDMLVSGSTVALVSFKNLIGVVIEDEAIANLQKNFIEIFWKIKDVE